MNKQDIKDWLQSITARLITIRRILIAHNFVAATGSVKTGACDIAFCLDDDDTTALRFLDWSEFKLCCELSRIGLTHPSYTYRKDLNRQLLAHLEDKIKLQDEIKTLRTRLTQYETPNTTPPDTDTDIVPRPGAEVQHSGSDNGSDNGSDRASGPSKAKPATKKKPAAKKKAAGNK